MKNKSNCISIVFYLVFYSGKSTHKKLLLCLVKKEAFLFCVGPKFDNFLLKRLYFTAKTERLSSVLTIVDKVSAQLAQWSITYLSQLSGKVA